MKKLFIKIIAFLSAFILMNCGGSETVVETVVVADDELSAAYTCVDLDADGFTVTVTDTSTVDSTYLTTCALVTDCDDDNKDVFPGATEYYNDGIDQNCDNSDSSDADDQDGDTFDDNADNCPTVSNYYQIDTDEDDYGDDCDAFPDDAEEWSDVDGDGIGDNGDVCPADADSEQTDTDEDGYGDVCDAFVDDAEEWADDDGDGVGDNGDVCPDDADAEQDDTDHDGEGNACASDDDGDGVLDDDDNCPYTPNSSQGDSDSDDVGNNCEDDVDADADGVGDDFDNCVDDANVGQQDADDDDIGDACDPTVHGDVDEDGDGFISNEDNCPEIPNADQSDVDEDGVGDACDEETCFDSGELDEDGDGELNCEDSDCTDSCEDNDEDGLFNGIDPQDDIKNPWGVIDQDYDHTNDEAIAGGVTCVVEQSAFAYTYLEGETGEICEYNSDCINGVFVGGVNTGTGTDHLYSYSCVGDSAEAGFSYGIYIIEADDDGDGLSNLIDPEIDTVNSWWTINTDVTDTRTFSTRIYDYTFIAGDLKDTETEQAEVENYELESICGELSENYILMCYDIGDWVSYGVTDWSQSGGEYNYDTDGDTTDDDYGVYVRSSLGTL